MAEDKEQKEQKERNARAGQKVLRERNALTKQKTQKERNTLAKQKTQKERNALMKQKIQKERNTLAENKNSRRRENSTQKSEEKQAESRLRTLRTLFFSTLYISSFTFGGGFVIVTLMKRRFADDLKWIDEKEMLDFTALAESCPGAVAVNAAILVGWKVCGFAGMLVAVLGTILPPILLLSVISLFYAAFSSNVWVASALRGMQAGVAAVVLDVAWELGSGVAREKSVFSAGILAAAFFCNFFLGVNVIFILLTAAAVGVLRLLASRKRERNERNNARDRDDERPANFKSYKDCKKDGEGRK